MIALSMALNIYVHAVIIGYKCDANKYTKCTKNLLDGCITGKTSVDKTEWVCSTCHLNLSDGKLPVCSKANKIGFPVKPECLNLTPLEERLISPPIPFMQINSLEGVNYLFMAMLLTYQLM